MQVKWPHSLNAKLFLLMSLSIIITIGGISWYHQDKFKDYLARDLEDGTVLNAKETANGVRGVLEYWLSVTSIAMQDPPLAAGRPKTDYYEPWASAFNTAFFELYQFPPGKSSWEARFVPITERLDAEKKQHELRNVVDAAVQDAMDSF